MATYRPNPSNLLDASVRQKLSPPTIMAYDNLFPDKDSNGMISAFIKTKADASDKIKNLGVNIGTVTGNLFTARFTPDKLIPLASITEVEYIDIGTAISPKDRPIGRIDNANKPTIKGGDNTTTANIKTSISKASIFTPKNILIGATAVLVMFGILKWQKVI